MSAGQYIAMFPLIETPYGSFYSFPEDLITSQLRRYGAHTRTELAMVLSFLKPGDCVLDIGAHIGTYTIPMARKVGSRGRVFSFEPNRDAFELLRRNVEINDCTAIVSLSPGLVTDEAGCYTPEFLAGNSGATHFRRSHQNRHRREDGQKIIESMTVDDWHRQNASDRRVDLMKIDVEGMELSVLLSAREVIRVFRPMVYVEVKDSSLQRYRASCKELMRVLNDWNYHFFRNRGERNSSSDVFIVERIERLTREARVYDVLCVHPGSQRYPSDR